MKKIKKLKLLVDDNGKQYPVVSLEFFGKKGFLIGWKNQDAPKGKRYSSGISKISKTIDPHIIYRDRGLIVRQTGK